MRIGMNRLPWKRTSWIFRAATTRCRITSDVSSFVSMESSLMVTGGTSI